MNRNRRICVVTGSRAEYGLLYWILRDLSDDPTVELQLVVTGMHLAPEFGLTWQTIEKDGFKISDRVEMLSSGDDWTATAKSIGHGVIGFADTFSRLNPDILLVLGDRFEIFSACQVALIANIPIAHIAGGDTTEGAFDEAIRHSITKMAHVHFVTNTQAVQRVRQMGENPLNIHMVGSPGLDNLRRLQLLNRKTLESELGIQFFPRNLLITFHPATLERAGSEQQMQALLDALEKLGPAVGLYFTKPNADPGGKALAAMLDQWVNIHANAWSFASLGQLRYLSLMAQVDCVVGNSSSGLYEAPSLHKPTVDIGDRQRGRLAAKSVIHCDADRDSILAAITASFTGEYGNVVNPYGDGHSSARIVALLKALPDPHALLKKRFHVLGDTHAD